jgi:hypothetical protein
MHKFACESQLMLTALMVPSSRLMEHDKRKRFRASSSGLNDPGKNANLIDT